MTVKELKEALEKFDDRLVVNVMFEGKEIGTVILVDGDDAEMYLEVRED